MIGIVYRLYSTEGTTQINLAAGNINKIDKVIGKNKEAVLTIANDLANDVVADVWTHMQWPSQK